MTGAQKHINRNEALSRAGIATTANKSDTKNLASIAAIGGNIGKTQLGAGLFAVPTKEEILKEKQTKDKIALQENSLVAFAMAEQPDLYAPNTLPFFSHNPSQNQKVLD